MAEFIGPSLPPKLRSGPEKETDNKTSDQGVIGPALPRMSQPIQEEGDNTPHEVIGPQIPLPIATITNTSSSSSSSSSGLDGSGAASAEAEDRRCEVPDAGVSDAGSYGPVLPPSFDCHPSDGGSDDDEGEIIGPLPVTERDTDSASLERVRREIEARSKSMKNKLTGQSSEPEGPQREEWMTSLPPGVKPLGLGPRKFRSSAQELGDRSVWTDTPADRIMKAQEAAHRQTKAQTQTGKAHNFLTDRDRELERQVAEHNEMHRGQSLLELHRKRKAQQQQQREEEEEGEGGGRRIEERQPFDRERDLALPKTLITPAKRRALEKDSATALQNKFSRGSNAFL